MMVLILGAVIAGQALNQPILWVDDDQGALTLVADPSEGGSVSGGGTYTTGATVSVKATAASNFVFVNWTAADGTIVSETASFSYTKQAGDETLTAHFQYRPGSPGEPDTPVFPEKKEKYKLTILAETGGSSPQGGGDYSVPKESRHLNLYLPSGICISPLRSSLPLLSFLFSLILDSLL